MGRGTARVIPNWEANESHLYLWDKDRYNIAVSPEGNGKTVNLIDQALPSIKMNVIVDAPPHLAAAEELICALRALGTEVLKVSSAAWGKLSPLFIALKVKDQRDLARALALKSVEGWISEGRSLIRNDQK